MVASMEQELGTKGYYRQKLFFFIINQMTTHPTFLRYVLFYAHFPVSYLVSNPFHSQMCMTN